MALALLTQSPPEGHGVRLGTPPGLLALARLVLVPLLLQLLLGPLAARPGWVGFNWYPAQLPGRGHLVEVTALRSQPVYTEQPARLGLILFPQFFRFSQR